MYKSTNLVPRLPHRLIWHRLSFLSLVFLWNRTSPLWLHRLTPREESLRTTLSYVPSSASLTMPPEALLCSSAAYPPPPCRLHLHLGPSTSLPPSLSSPSTSPLLFILSSPSSDVYAPPRQSCCPFWSRFSSVRFTAYM